MTTVPVLYCSPRYRNWEQTDYSEVTPVDIERDLAPRSATYPVRTRTGCLDYGDGTFGWAHGGGK